jgi:tetratricopeptide (TPR) repeat protein
MKRLQIIIILTLLITSEVAISQIRDLSPGLHHVQNGDNKMRINDWEGAALEYTTAIKVDPDLADAYYKRAIVYTKLARLREAEEDKRKALLMNPRIEKFYDTRAMLSSLYIDPGNAKGDFMETLILQTYSPIVISVNDSSLRALELKRAKIEDLTKIIDKNKKDTLALLQRAKQYYDEGLLDEALNDVNAVLNLKIKNAKAFEIRGAIQMLRENYLFAIDDLSKSIEFNPISPQAWFNRGLARVYKSDDSGALSDFLNALKLDDTFWEAAYNAAILRMKFERYKDAIVEFDKAIRINNTIGYIYFYRGLCQYNLSAFQSAYDDFERSYQLGEYIPESLNNHAVLHLYFNEPKNAINDLNEAIKLDPDYAKAYYNRGLANIMNFLRVKACNDFQQSHMLDFQPAFEAINDFCGN